MEPWIEFAGPLCCQHRPDSDLEEAHLTAALIRTATTSPGPLPVEEIDVVLGLTA